MAFGIAMMLTNRKHYAEIGRCFRCLACDASPQRGLEVFETVERRVNRNEVNICVASGAAHSQVLQRRRSSVPLGSGRMSFSDKRQAHVHQLWLEYRPTVQGARMANRHVRQDLSEIETQLGIDDATDVVANVIDPGQAGGSLEYLHPLALGVPGSKHILETVLQFGLQTLQWWRQWQA